MKPSYSLQIQQRCVSPCLWRLPDTRSSRNGHGRKTFSSVPLTSCKREYVRCRFSMPRVVELKAYDASAKIINIITATGVDYPLYLNRQLGSMSRQLRSLTPTVWAYHIVTHGNMVKSFEKEIQNYQMGFIPDPSHTSLPEYKGNEKIKFTKFHKYLYENEDFKIFNTKVAKRWGEV